MPTSSGVHNPTAEARREARTATGINPASPSFEKSRTTKRTTTRIVRCDADKSADRTKTEGGEPATESRSVSRTALQPSS